MRIGELSGRTGVPVPTIKYYVREGLLAPGELTSPNQASYGDAHERRLRLIRALLEVGGLSVANIGEVLVAVDDKQRSTHKLLGAAADLLVPGYTGDGCATLADGDADGAPDAELDADPDVVVARKKVADLIAARDWHVSPDSPQAQALTTALAALSRIGHGGFAEVLDAYATAAEGVARADLAHVGRGPAREDLIEEVVVGIVMGDAMFAALRRMAQVDGSSRAFGTGGAAGPDGLPG
ncbi:MerR family transcriptional regulator [Streptomyces sp. NPDC001568]|uniref:MerR family transcriptional regulator n=1 Tax=Streptomyces sp. NPDC001568 TaxID=3364588 RepID=UPI00367F1D38